MSKQITIRPLQAEDHDAWRRLWTDYLTFYETSVPDTVYASTWKRLLGGGEHDPNGLIAIGGDEPLGITHYIFHRHCWHLDNVCYLQDLYVDEAARGTGLGRALIEAVYGRADQAGCPSVYWMTQDFNERGRRLYDRVGELTPFIKYRRPD